jgi:hypothetical protein
MAKAPDKSIDLHQTDTSAKEKQAEDRERVLPLRTPRNIGVAAVQNRHCGSKIEGGEEKECIQVVLDFEKKRGILGELTDGLADRVEVGFVLRGWHAEYSQQL